MIAILKNSLAAILLTTLAGCFPYVTSYVHLEASGARYQREVCNQFGPYVALDLERSGVQIRVSLEPGYSQRSKFGFLRLRAPRDVIVSIPNPTALIRFRDDKVALPTQLALTPPPRERINKFAPLKRDDRIAEYVFEFVDFPFISEPGSLTLPEIVVDGAALALPVIAFQRRPFAGILPLNC